MTEALLHPNTHPLVVDAAGAVSRPKAWRDYRDMTHALLGHHREFTDERPSSVLAWLHDLESLVLAQQARRGQRIGQAPIGTLEGHIGTVRP